MSAACESDPPTPRSDAARATSPATIAASDGDRGGDERGGRRPPRRGDGRHPRLGAQPGPTGQDEDDHGGQQHEPERAPVVGAGGLARPVGGQRARREADGQRRRGGGHRGERGRERPQPRPARGERRGQPQDEHRDARARPGHPERHQQHRRGGQGEQPRRAAGHGAGGQANGHGGHRADEHGEVGEGRQRRVQPPRARGVMPRARRDEAGEGPERDEGRHEDDAPGSAGRRARGRAAGCDGRDEDERVGRLAVEDLPAAVRRRAPRERDGGHQGQRDDRAHGGPQRPGRAQDEPGRRGDGVDAGGSRAGPQAELGAGPAVGHPGGEDAEGDEGRARLDPGRVRHGARPAERRGQAAQREERGEDDEPRAGAGRGGGGRDRGAGGAGVVGGRAGGDGHRDGAADGRSSRGPVRRPRARTP